MMDNKVVTDGYIKLLALSVSHLMTEIIMEKNTNNQEDIDAFREKYGNIKTIIIFVIHMDNCDDIVYDDYSEITDHVSNFIRGKYELNSDDMEERKKKIRHEHVKKYYMLMNYER